MIKKIIFLLLISFCFFSYKNEVFARVMNCDADTCGGYEIVSLSFCSVGASRTCNKGSSSQCGVGFCSSEDSGCCVGAHTWTKYKQFCIKIFDGWGYTYDLVWGNYDTQCSIGDKCLNGEQQLRPGYCTCGSYGSAYKACCNNITGAQVACQQLTGDGQFPPEGQCPSGSHVHNLSTDGACCTNNCALDSASHCAGTTYTGNCGQTCTGTKPTVPPITPLCGYSSTDVFSTPPSSNLCAPGTASAVTTNATTYTWTCTGTAGTCPTVAAGVANCSVIRNSPPVLEPLIIKNNTGNPIIPETGNRNQICQTAFNGSRMVTFEVSISDADNDIVNATLSWNGKNIPRISPIGPVTIFQATFDNSFNDGGAYPLIVTVTDSAGQSDTDSSRNFKIWDCEVSAFGTAYDGSSTDSSCSNESFTTTITIPYSLIMNNVSGGVDKNMAVASPNYSGSLVWGQSYIFNPTIGGSNLKLRFNDNMSTCTNSLQFLVDNNKADPYNSSVQFDTDFTSVLDQDPWWQTSNGGAFSNSLLNNQVPVTCTTSDCKISLNALVSSLSINNRGLSQDSAQFWYYESPTAKLANSNTNYSYFFNQYYVKNGIGTVLSGNKTIADITGSPTGIYFVDGNLDINANKIVPAGTFFMIIVKGNINVANTVTQVDGILVANNIYATGDNATPLTFNGSLYASNNVEFTRTYTDKADNNTKAAVIVNHNPQMIFKLPGSLAKVLTNWQWGN